MSGTKCLLGFLVSVLFLISCPAITGATVVNFDDLIGQGPVPNGYAGLTWDSLWMYYDTPQQPYNPHSGNTRIYQGAGIYQGAWIQFPDPVDFKGAWFSGYPTCHFEGYQGDVLIGQSVDLEMSATPTFLPAGFTSWVDKVTVVCESLTNGNLFVMDDLTYDPYSFTNVPEFPTIAVPFITLTGLLLAVLVLRWRN
jgi:hypothetical protein